jgi:hypothetical protein
MYEKSQTAIEENKTPVIESSNPFRAQQTQGDGA